MTLVTFAVAYRAAVTAGVGSKHTATCCEAIRQAQALTDGQDPTHHERQAVAVSASRHPSTSKLKTSPDEHSKTVGAY